jgi:heptosyltransferase II
MRFWPSGVLMMPNPSPETAILQPLPGIGDMVWHEPIFAALAAADPSGRIDLIARKTVPAAAIFGDAPYFHQIRPLPLFRGLWGQIRNFLILVRLIRAGRYQRLFILSDSQRYKRAAQIAGVAEIYTYTPADLAGHAPVAGRDHTLFPLTRAKLLLDRAHIPCPRLCPRITARPNALAHISARFKDLPRPWIIFGLGSTDHRRQWPMDRFAAIADRLAEKLAPTIFLLGAAHESPLAQQVETTCKIARPLPVTDLSLEDAIALLSLVDFALCNDSGPMNLAAALNIPVYALFGAVAPYDYSPALIPITPKTGPDRDHGTQRITIDDVWQALNKGR